MKRVKTLSIYFGAVIICIMLVLYADTSAEAAALAVNRCLNILIPSLFVFMAASNILIKSGAYKVISIPFYPIARYIFKMPYELFSVILISNISGFPVGASMLAELVEEKRISRKAASIMQCFCYGGGPSFSVGVIGLILYGDKKIGYIICLSTFIANLIAALILCRLFEIRLPAKKENERFTSNDLIACTEKAGSSMLMICALVVIFCVIMAVFQRVLSDYTSLYISQQANAMIKAVFEISSISSLNNAKISFIPLISALFSFGGVCVVMQIISAVKDRYSLLPFFISRLPVSFIAYFTSAFLCRVFVVDTKNCIAVSDDFIVNFNNFIPSICLILMIFLLLFKKGVAFFCKI